MIFMKKYNLLIGYIFKAVAWLSLFIVTCGMLLFFDQVLLRALIALLGVTTTFMYFIDQVRKILIFIDSFRSEELAK